MDFLGLEKQFDLGWVTSFRSPENRAIQVNLVSGDASAPPSASPAAQGLILKLRTLPWRATVITGRDLRHPESVPSRVYGALVRAGYRGPAPRLSMMWKAWFRHASEGLGRF